MNLFLFSFILGYCFAPSLPDNDLVGTWRYDRGDGSSFLLSFAADNTYSADLDQDGVPDLKGKYTVEGDTMTIEDTTGDCVGKVGVYTMQMEGKLMTLTEVSDDCADRSAGAGQTFQMAKQ